MGAVQRIGALTVGLVALVATEALINLRSFPNFWQVFVLQCVPCAPNTASHTRDSGGITDHIWSTRGVDISGLTEVSRDEFSRPELQ